MMTTRVLPSLAITCFLIAGSLWIYSLYLDHHLPRRTVYDEPFKFEKGFHATGTFVVDITTEYSVGMNCVRTMSLENLEAVFKNDVDIDYTISCNNQIIARGSSSHWGGESFSQTDITSYFGSPFTAEPAKTYTLDLFVNKTTASLAHSNDRATVEGLDVVFWKGVGLGGVGEALSGVFFGIFGVIFFISFLVRLVVKQRKNSNK